MSTTAAKVIPRTETVQKRQGYVMFRPHPVDAAGDYRFAKSTDQYMNVSLTDQLQDQVDRRSAFQENARTRIHVASALSPRVKIGAGNTEGKKTPVIIAIVVLLLIAGVALYFFKKQTNQGEANQ